jgi:phosphoserine aminotransferase
VKKIYFTVGPTQSYPTLGKHVLKGLKSDIPSLSHRGPEFKALYKELTLNLKKLLNIPEDYQVLFVSSALEGMERIILGCVEKTSLHIVTGSFGASWFKYASQLNKKPIKVDLVDAICHPERSEGYNLGNESHLYSSAMPQNDSILRTLNIPKEAEVICITQNDTSTGIALPMEDIHNLKLHNPKKLIAIDVVSSIPYVDIDFSKIDITFFSVQKGFGLPAGLGVMVVSPRALEKAGELLRKGLSIGSYHSLINLSEKAKDFQTPETPNVLNIFLFNRVLKDMLKVGINRIRKETDQKAKLMYEFFERHQEFEPFVKEKKYRSQTTLVMDVKGKTKLLRQKLSKKGLDIGAGYGEQKENHIRLGNFPAHKTSDVKRMLSLI